MVAEAEPASSAPLLLATQSKTAYTSAPDYFNTGEYSENRTQQLLQEDISNTAKTQTLSYHGSTYTFYTVLDTDSATPSFYQLYCSVDGQHNLYPCQQKSCSCSQQIPDPQLLHLLYKLSGHPCLYNCRSEFCRLPQSWFPDGNIFPQTQLHDQMLHMK